jgi:signal transduction histidine kinase
MDLQVSYGMTPGLQRAFAKAPFYAERWNEIKDLLEPGFSADIRKIPSAPPEIAEHGMTGEWWMPIKVSGKPWGMILLFGEVPGLSFDEKNLVNAVSDLLGAAIENDLLQKRANQAAVMEERQRLARDLHDSVSQSIYGLTLLAEAGRENALEGNREPTLHYLERTSETAHQALREMRMLLYELRPPELEKLGLEGALRYRLEAVEGRVGIVASITAKQTAPISGEYQEAFFWIALEALNNILKHANASRVNLNLRVGARRTKMEIADNGQGFEPGAGGGGMGLIGMRERAEKIGARLSIESAPGKGTRVSVELDPAHAMKEKSENE